MTISELRDLSGVLDTEMLASMLIRFKAYQSESKLSDAEVLETLLQLCSHQEYMDKKDKIVKVEGKGYRLIQPYSYNKKEASLSAITHPIPRFGRFSGPVEVLYPLSADLKIRYDVECMQENEIRNIFISMNQIKGILKDGRTAHWSDLSNVKPNYSYNHSGYGSFNRSLQGASGWFTDPLYRVTPKNQKKVSELLSIGMKVKTNYHEHEYIIKSIHESTHIAEERDERETNNAFTAFSLSLLDAKTLKGGYYINNLVAMNGKILKLFYSNMDEVFIVSSEKNEFSIKHDFNEDENESTPCGSFDKKKKRIQLSLF